MGRGKHVNKRAGGQTNPLKEDPELNVLLTELDGVQDKYGFDQWRESFLARFVEFLEHRGTSKAEVSYWNFSDTMAGFVNVLNKLNDYIDDGSLSETKCSVRARKCLQEYAKTITQVIQEVEALVPGTMESENACGYTKFHMGAVLVQDGFREYGRLSLCAAVLEKLRVPLEHVADRQILELMARYGHKLVSFCSIMEDLGLAKVMLKCREFVQADEDEVVIESALSDAVVQPISETPKHTDTSSSEEDADTNVNTNYPAFHPGEARLEIGVIRDADSDCQPLDEMTKDREPAPYSMTWNGSTTDHDPAPYSLGTPCENKSLALHSSPRHTLDRAPAPYSSASIEAEETETPQLHAFDRKPAPYSSTDMNDKPETQRLFDREPAPYASMPPRKETAGNPSAFDREPAPYSSASVQNKEENSTVFQREPAPYSSTQSQTIDREKHSSHREPTPYSSVSTKKEKLSGSSFDREPAPYSSAFHPSATEREPATYSHSSPRREPAPYSFSSPRSSKQSHAAKQARTSPESLRTQAQKKVPVKATANNGHGRGKRSEPTHVESKPKHVRWNPKTYYSQVKQKMQHNQQKGKAKKCRHEGKTTSQREPSPYSSHAPSRTETKPQVAKVNKRTKPKESGEQSEKRKEPQRKQESSSKQQKQNVKSKLQNIFATKKKNTTKQTMRGDRDPAPYSISNVASDDPPKSPPNRAKPGSSVSSLRREQAPKCTIKGAEPAIDRERKQKCTLGPMEAESDTLPLRHRKRTTLKRFYANIKDKIESKIQESRNRRAKRNSKTPKQAKKSTGSSESVVIPRDQSSNDSGSSSSVEESQSAMSYSSDDVSESETAVSDDQQVEIKESGETSKPMDISMKESNTRYVQEIASGNPVVVETVHSDDSSSSESVGGDINDELTDKNRSPQPSPTIPVPLTTPPMRSRSFNQAESTNKESKSIARATNIELKKDNSNYEKKKDQTLVVSGMDEPASSRTFQREETKIVTMHQETSRKCYMWYGRMAQPNRQDMKRRVAKLPETCDISVQDVEELPWICNGARLSVHKMNQLMTEGYYQK